MVEGRRNLRYVRPRALALLCLIAFVGADVAVVAPAAQARCRTIYCIPTPKKKHRSTKHRTSTTHKTTRHRATTKHKSSTTHRSTTHRSTAKKTTRHRSSKHKH